MYLPAPDEPIRYLPNAVIYHYYPMDFVLDKEVVHKNSNGQTYKKMEKQPAVAYMNIVLPYRVAEAYRRSKNQYIDFGLDYIVDRKNCQLYFHNSYGVSDDGLRALTNVVAYHRGVYDGTNPEKAYVIIGNESILHSAMVSILKTLTQVPFLSSHVPRIVDYARSSGYGVVRYMNHIDWIAPRWTIARDKKAWNIIILDWFKESGYDFVS